jgi:hypothetical protein
LIGDNGRKQDGKIDKEIRIMKMDDRKKIIGIHRISINTSMMKSQKENRVEVKM